MTQITHAEAQRLINFNADQPLDASTYRILDTHLNDCAECRNYAHQLNEVENILRKIKDQWNSQSTPLPLISVTHQNTQTNPGFSRGVVATRMVMMVLTIVIMMATVTWRYSIPNSASPTAPQMAIPIPTPSTHLTSTKVTTLNCVYMSYQVRSNDTLNSIAAQFSIPKETIMKLNGLSEEKIETGMQIRIPICDHTPTVPSDAPNTIITTSPQIEPITQTPA